jgi:hypothetical protein
MSDHPNLHGGKIPVPRRLLAKYALLTLGFLVPLTWSFVKVRNLYPIASWNVMTRGGEIDQSYTYFVLRGETVSGETIDISAAKLTNAMRSRTWGLVAATIANESLKLPAPHPKNAALLAQMPADQLPEGTRLGDLLRAWGQSYNSRYPAPSPLHLKAIRLDAYRWPGREYSNFDQYVQSWREEL